MAWQDVFPVSSPRIAAEEDRELRLVAQARAGADWALTALVARYQPPVTRYLTRLTGNADLARALAELVFVRMERRLHGPEGGRHLRLWLLRASTEAGLDALRQPKSGKPAARLTSPPRPVGLLAGTGGPAAVQRLKARLGMLAQATLQTRRQVRKLIWSSTPDVVVAPDFEADEHAADHAPPPPAVEEPADGHDPREALRYRIVRAVLAELPYGDAQCVALHLVAGLNQAEVAAALGLTNSATRRRIVQGLQLFAQRFNAAAASLGISPDALVTEEAHPLEPGVGGYMAVQEQPTVSMRSPYVAAAAPTEAEVAGPAVPAEEPPLVAEPPAAGVVEADGAMVEADPVADEAPPVVVEALPAPAETQPAPTAALPPHEAALLAGEEHGDTHAADELKPAPMIQSDDDEETTLPAALLAAAVARVFAEHEGAPPSAADAPDGPALASPEPATEDVADAATPSDGAEGDVLAETSSPMSPSVPAASPDSADDVAPPPLVPAARHVPVLTSGASVRAPAPGVPETAAGQAPEAPVVPVLTPRARQRVDTVPRRHREGRHTPLLLRGAGTSGLTGD